MKKAKSSHTSLLTKYSQLYEKNPKSRVFAPLAESYRKIGMLDESLNILRKGIKQHPSYILGYIVLAHCYFDKEQFEMAYNTLRPFVSQNLENLSLQKLFARTCVKLGYLEEALNSYKNLLLVNPRDQYVAEQVKLLEDDLLVSQEEPAPTFLNRRLEDSVFADDKDDWVQVDFNKTIHERRDPRRPKNMLGDEWNLVSVNSETPLEKFKSDLREKKFDVTEHELDDTYFWEDYDNPADDTIEAEEDEIADKVNEKPIITHTLVDLYCRQGHYLEAIEILKSILQLHPTDQATIAKLKKITAMLHSSELNEDSIPSDQIIDSTIDHNEDIDITSIYPEFNNFEDTTEETSSEYELSESDGHNELLSLIDKTKEKEDKRLDQIKKQLGAFLSGIKIVAKSKNGEVV